MAKIDVAAYRKRMGRANELPLLGAVLLFQFVSLFLLAFRDGGVDAFSLRASALVPLGTYLGLRVLQRLWPIDRAVYILVAFLSSLSVILLRAVFKKTTNASDQAAYLAIGYAAMLFGAGFIRAARNWERVAKLAMLPCLLVLLLPFGFANATAKNWVRLGGMQFQPSELMKPVTVVILASGFSDKRGWRSWVWYAAFAAAACGILLAERDLGAMFLYFALTVAMFYAGTHNGKIALGVLFAAAGGAFFAIRNVNEIAERIPAFRYVAERIAIWKNPWNSSYENARQIMQGLISIASGGVFGSGLGLGSADRVAVVASDYIFAAVSEEFGILFAIAVLGVYLTLLLRGMMTALNARQRFHALAAFGCAFELTAQMLLIVCGNLHILPLTGVTLPFVSEGGSSLMACMALAGMILGVSSVNAQDEYDDLMRISGGQWREEE